MFLYRAGQQGSYNVNWLSPGADAVPIMDAVAFPACLLLYIFLSWFTVYLFGVDIVMYADIVDNYGTTLLFSENSRELHNFQHKKHPVLSNPHFRRLCK